LAAATAFAGLVQFALICSFVWPELLSPDVPPWAAPVTAWVLVLGFWIVGYRQGRLELAQLRSPPATDDPQLEAWFREAQSKYLKGHWIEAETLVSRLLACRADDIEARLLLASICRRTGRLAEARKTLHTLKQLDSAANWRLEITTELQQLTELETNDQSSEPTSFPLARAA
jgi:hypothetical protein